MMQINADKPHLWKSDVEKSIDFFNDWSLRFVPETFRSQRSVTTVDVARALDVTDYLRKVTPANLIANPHVLPILRMVCAPPIARDRLIGLAKVSKNLVLAMEGKPGTVSRIPPQMRQSELIEHLQRICETIKELVDRDLCSWLDLEQEPADEEVNRAASIVADRLCSATADPIVRNAQERRQLASLQSWLELHGYRQVPSNAVDIVTQMMAGTFAFRLNIIVSKGKDSIKIPVDCVIQPQGAELGNIPVLVEAKSAGDATNTNKRRKEEAQKMRQLKLAFGDNIVYILLLCGYFEPGYLGYEAAEGIDWIWEHRLNDLALLLKPANQPDEEIREETIDYHKGLYDKEKIRLKRQQLIDASKTQEQRNQLGQFSTPFKLAKEIVHYALSQQPVASALNFLEPALGTGVFFSALAACAPENTIMQATGIEIDPAYGDVAQSLWSNAPYVVVCDDFLTFSADPDHYSAFNLLCTNPPYVRHHHLASELKQRLQQRLNSELGITVSGLSGLYVYFLLLSHAVLVEHAIASWLIPSEFLSVNYGKVLRQYLLQHVTLLRIHQFDSAEVQFEDALVSSCVVTYRKTKPKQRYEFLYSCGGSIEAPKISRLVPSDDHSLDGKWRFEPFTEAVDCLDNSLKIGDLFTIKRGIATGSNGFFILDDISVRNYSIPNRFLKPILASPRYLKDPIIESDQNGFPQISNPRHLLDCSLLPDVIRERYPRVWDYLKLGENKGVPDAYLCSSRKIWYLQEQRDPPLFLVSYMGRSRESRKSPFRFFLNLSQAVATNVFLLLYPKPALLSALGRQRERMEEILHILNGLDAAVLIDGGRTYGGGLHKLEPRELANLRLPRIPNWLQANFQIALAFEEAADGSA